MLYHYLCPYCEEYYYKIGKKNLYFCPTCKNKVRLVCLEAKFGCLLYSLKFILWSIYKARLSIIAFLLATWFTFCYNYLMLYYLNDASKEVCLRIEYSMYCLTDPEKLEQIVEQLKKFYTEDQVERFFRYRKRKEIFGMKLHANWFINKLCKQKYNDLTVEEVYVFVNKFTAIKRLFGVNADFVIKLKQSKEVNITLDNILLFFNAYVMKDPEALYILGVRYFYGFYPVKLNKELADKLLTYSADQGFEKAMLFIFFYY